MPNNPHIHNERRDTLRELLLGGPATTQKALVDALNGRGYVATQSSVSRDLKELGAVKTSHGYELLPSSLNGIDEITKIGDLLRELKPAGPNLLIIKTAIGAAQQVALALDLTGWPEIVGNVGGDDTVFVATANATSQNKVIARINSRSSRSQA